MVDSTNWGGKRKNSGRKPKPEHEKQKTVVIRIPENLLQTIELLKQGKPLNDVTNNQALTAEFNRLNAMAINCYQCINWQDDKCSKGLTLAGICCNDLELWQRRIAELEKEINENLAELEQLTAELEKCRAGNMNFSLKCENQNLEIVSLKSKITGLQTEPAKLKKELSELKRQLNQQKTIFCQCLTAKGYQCNKPATHHDIKHKGLIIAVCEQHYQSVINSGK